MGVGGGRGGRRRPTKGKNVIRSKTALLENYHLLRIHLKSDNAQMTFENDFDGGVVSH